MRAVLKGVDKSKNYKFTVPTEPGRNLTLGRQPLTGIKDVRLSRNHVRLYFENGRLLCRNVGQNCSSVNEKRLLSGDNVELNDGDVVQLLAGKHGFKVYMAKDDANSESAPPNDTKKAANRFHWSQGLYASMSDPDLVVYEDDKVCIIKDKYPKAMRHFLVLPREKMASLHDLGRSHGPLVGHMIGRAEELAARPENRDHVFAFGFHAVPSMAQVHMHVVSRDFVSPCLKTKKHWNSFNTAYFIPAADVKQFLDDDAMEQFLGARGDKKRLLAADLACNQCAYAPKNMPDLKKHLEAHLAKN